MLNKLLKGIKNFVIENKIFVFIIFLIFLSFFISILFLFKEENVVEGLETEKKNFECGDGQIVNLDGVSNLQIIIEKATYGGRVPNRDYTSQVQKLVGKGSYYLTGGIHRVIGDPEVGVGKRFRVKYYGSDKIKIVNGQEGQPINLSVPSGQEIVIVRAVYGGNDRNRDYTSFFQNIVNGIQTYSSTGNINAVFGDPERGTFKYYQILYYGQDSQATILARRITELQNNARPIVNNAKNSADQAKTSVDQSINDLLSINGSLGNINKSVNETISLADQVINSGKSNIFTNKSADANIYLPTTTSSTDFISNLINITKKSVETATAEKKTVDSTLVNSKTVVDSANNTKTQINDLLISIEKKANDANSALSTVNDESSIPPITTLSNEVTNLKTSIDNKVSIISEAKRMMLTYVDTLNTSLTNVQKANNDVNDAIKQKQDNDKAEFLALEELKKNMIIEKYVLSQGAIKTCGFYFKTNVFNPIFSNNSSNLYVENYILNSPYGYCFNIDNNNNLYSINNDAYSYTTNDINTNIKYQVNFRTIINNSDFANCFLRLLKNGEQLYRITYDVDSNTKTIKITILKNIYIIYLDNFYNYPETSTIESNITSNNIKKVTYLDKQYDLGKRYTYGQLYYTNTEYYDCIVMNV